MGKELLNGELEFRYPDSFRMLSPEEKKKMTFLVSGPGEVFVSPDDHITISIGWTKAGGITSRLLNSYDLIKNSESKIKKALKPSGYALEKIFSADIGGAPSDAVRYTYTSQGIGMVGETWCVKIVKNIYYFNFYYRQDLREESLELLREIRRSVDWV